MPNKIVIDDIIINNNRITYNYTVTGEWKEAFKIDEAFYIEYSCNIKNVPKSVAVIPLLANLLPMAWVYDAAIYLPVCDEDFYYSIKDLKKGYEEMYPMMQLKGNIIVDELQKNKCNGSGKAVFFSGGVDAFNTLVNHADERPTLLTVWGADVQFEDAIGWERVQKHLMQTAKSFGVGCVTIKSCFRRFLDEGVLTRKVKKSGDGWWHGFQHGIGIISHAAPVMYVLGSQTVYFASSFTAADKGKVTCASDPTIDNHVHFCGANVCHDGYEFNRQMKIHNIVQFSKKTGRKIALRVCWQSSGGSNCCNCEKCWRTILGIYAEGFDPKEFGFYYNNKQLFILANKMRYSGDKMFSALRYSPIQKAMQKNVKKNTLPKSIRWFYGINISILDEIPFWCKAIRKAKRIVKAISKI